VKTIGWLALALALPAVAFVLGCGDLAPEVEPDGGPGAMFPDAGAGFFDGGVEEDGPEFNGTPLMPSSPDTVPGLGSNRAEDADELAEDPSDRDGSTASCYDGAENSGDSLVDCEDPRCQGLRTCCIGRVGCCSESGIDAIGFDLSTVSALEACATPAAPASCVGATAFGSPAPFLDLGGVDDGSYEYGGLALGGDGEFDSGLYWEEAVDLRTRRLTIEADLTQVSECGATCLESASFGVTTQAPSGDVHVEPLAALTMSAALGRVVLWIGGAQMASWEARTGGTWTLSLTPSDATAGATVHVVHGDVDERFPYTPEPNARVVAWGHSRNPGASGEAGVRITRLHAQAALCDMPRGVRDRGLLEVRTRGTEAPRTSGSAPSIAEDGMGRATVAWATPEGTIRVAKRSEGLDAQEVVAVAETAVLTPETTSAHLTDPELVWDPELPDGGGFHLFVTRVDESGRPWPTRATGTADATTFGGMEPLDLGALETSFGVTEAEQASVVRLPEASRGWAMVLRVTIGTQRRIVAMASDDGRVWEPWSEVDAGGWAEAADPSLIVHDRAYQLLVSVRRGSRWQQALYGSDELLHWRLVDDAAMRGAGEQYESLGVAAVDAFSRGAEIELVYEGIDGSGSTLFRAARDALIDAPLGT